ncbi:hypothetical protein QR680_008199 [Steinernema hermaphroditum]|uniref:Uncharacterized protein n=1 Tax=Steinernema hermaphroditum TaxID=289476 RepID=A0AA39M7P4_9BILA|nr:hypothetical protein QR680_008199 [Steinernema hermaphroditum]
MRRRIACEDQSVILVTTRSPSAEEIAEVEKNKAEGQFRARLSDAKPRRSPHNELRLRLLQRRTGKDPPPTSEQIKALVWKFHLSEPAPAPLP